VDVDPGEQASAKSQAGHQGGDPCREPGRTGPAGQGQPAQQAREDEQELQVDGVEEQARAGQQEPLAPAEPVAVEQPVRQGSARQHDRIG
jgi:hypothetical protein